MLYLHIISAMPLYQPLFTAFATAAFLKLVIFSIFEMRLLLMIWKARRPQAFAEGWVNMRRELGILYARFYCSMLLGIALAYQVRHDGRVRVHFCFACLRVCVYQSGGIEPMCCLRDYHGPSSDVFIHLPSPTFLSPFA